MTITVRKAHVKRVFQTDEDTGEVTDEDIWIDVLRIDQYVTSLRGAGGGYQDIVVNLRWRDKEDDEPNTQRHTRKIKIENPNDDTQFVMLDVLDRITILNPAVQWQGANWVQKNKRNDSGRTADRTFYVKRVGHKEVDEDIADMSDVVDWQLYQQAIEGADEDTDQYIDYELIKTMGVTVNPDAQGIRDKLHNGELAQLQTDAPDDADTDKIVRLDPFQMIVNVNFGGGIVMTASSRFADPASRLGFTSKDGDTWELFGPPATGFDGFFAYAHGNGVTLMDSSAGTWRSTDGGQTWDNIGEIEPGGFAFGKVQDPDNPTGPKIGRFVGISRGGDLYYSEDGLAWTGAGFETFLGGEFCQFVNGVFFAFSGSYLSWPDVDQNDLWTRIASSRDGISWTEALLWHPDSFSYGDGGPDQTVWPTGIYETTGVAWDGNHFVVVGNMPIVKQTPLSGYTYVNTAFSASSPDGFSWSGQSLIYTDDFVGGDSYTGYASFAYGIAAGKLPEPSNATMWVVVGSFNAGPPFGSRSYNYAWSTDGASWNAAATIAATPDGGPSNALSGIVFSNKKFIACGVFWDYSSPEVGMLWESDNGTNWTRGNTGFDETVAQFNALYKK